MSEIMNTLSKFSAAEEFLDFFGIDYQPAVVHVNRLHIMKRFNQYLRATTGVWSLDATAQKETCKQLLQRAHDDFVRSTPAKEKVFKVFQDQDGSHVSLDNLRAALPPKNTRSPDEGAPRHNLGNGAQSKTPDSAVLHPGYVAND